MQSTNYYLSALENGTSMGGDGDILEHEDTLSFVNFPVAGSAQTYDSTSFCPDSASTATSIRTQDLLRHHQYGRDRHREL